MRSLLREGGSAWARLPRDSCDCLAAPMGKCSTISPCVQPMSNTVGRVATHGSGPSPMASSPTAEPDQWYGVLPGTEQLLLRLQDTVMRRKPNRAVRTRVCGARGVQSWRSVSARRARSTRTSLRRASTRFTSPVYDASLSAPCLPIRAGKTRFGSRSHRRARLRRSGCLSLRQLPRPPFGVPGARRRGTA
jgi:hypothetical protein